MLTIVDDIAFNFEIVLDSAENHLKVQNDLVRVNWQFDIIINWLINMSDSNRVGLVLTASSIPTSMFPHYFF